MGFRSSFSKSLFQSGPGYRANLAQSGKLCGSFGGMDSASELADGIADLADGVAELADGVITKHGTALHGTRLPRTTRFRKKMQLSAKLGYIHCDAKDVIAGVRSSRESRGSRGSTLLVTSTEVLWAILLPVKRHRGEPGHTSCYR